MTRSPVCQAPRDSPLLPGLLFYFLSLTIATLATAIQAGALTTCPSSSDWMSTFGTALDASSIADVVNASTSSGVMGQQLQSTLTNIIATDNTTTVVTINGTSGLVLTASTITNASLDKVISLASGYTVAVGARNTNGRNMPCCFGDALVVWWRDNPRPQSISSAGLSMKNCSGNIVAGDAYDAQNGVVLAVNFQCVNGSQKLILTTLDSNVVYGSNVSGVQLTWTGASVSSTTIGPFAIVSIPGSSDVVICGGVGPSLTFLARLDRNVAGGTTSQWIGTVSLPMAVDTTRAVGAMFIVLDNSSASVIVVLNGNDTRVRVMCLNAASGAHQWSALIVTKDKEGSGAVATACVVTSDNILIIAASVHDDVSTQHVVIVPMDITTRRVISGPTELNRVLWSLRLTVPLAPATFVVHQVMPHTEDRQKVWLVGMIMPQAPRNESQQYAFLVSTPCNESGTSSCGNSGCYSTASNMLSVNDSTTLQTSLTAGANLTVASISVTVTHPVDVVINEYRLDHNESSTCSARRHTASQSGSVHVMTSSSMSQKRSSGRSLATTSTGVPTRTSSEGCSISSTTSLSVSHSSSGGSVSESTPSLTWGHSTTATIKRTVSSTSATPTTNCGVPFVTRSLAVPCPTLWNDGPQHQLPSPCSSPVADAAASHNATWVTASCTTASIIENGASLDFMPDGVASTWPPSTPQGSTVYNATLTFALSALPDRVPVWVGVPLGGGGGSGLCGVGAQWTMTAAADSAFVFVTAVMVNGANASFSHQNLTLQKGLLYVLLEAFPVSGGVTTFSSASMLLASCEAYRVHLAVVLRWPERKLSVASEALATTATVAALTLNAADVTSAMSAVLVTFLSCAAVPPGRSAVAYVLSVFFDLGYAAMAIGNALLMCALFLVHAGAGKMLSRYASSSAIFECVVENGNQQSAAWLKENQEEATAALGHMDCDSSSKNLCGMHTTLGSTALLRCTTRHMHWLGWARFPSLSLQAAALLGPGSAFGAAAALAMIVLDSNSTSSEISSVSATGAIVGLVLTFAALVVLPYVLLRHVVLHLVDVTPYAPDALTGPVWERRLIYPKVRWTPEAPARAFRPLVSTMRQPVHCYLICVESGLALVLACVTGAIVGDGSRGDGVACGAGPVIIALSQYLYVLVLVIVRPHRLPIDRVFCPAYHALLGTVCTLKYVGGEDEDINHVADMVQQSLLCVQLWKSLWAAYIMWFREGRYAQSLSPLREHQWNHGDKDHDDMNSDDAVERLAINDGDETRMPYAMSGPPLATLNDGGGHDSDHSSNMAMLGPMEMLHAPPPPIMRDNTVTSTWPCTNMVSGMTAELHAVVVSQKVVVGWQKNWLNCITVCLPTL